ncbi:carboxylesterase [Pseudoxanthomonas broegbernensis]|uniref:Carboxylic ester hydrolase n=1 Tax=Pseudoxanthomonas broegbernensis TaxID=83619 RepID=A0A7V8GMY9_9GAMM|nr:carboxylesterase/lipase family protein [Pseudoxanthomonas broegbernensis]KAF1686814.1 carboxylesterase [Pseudoxanthomonas broegbernensis]MBB6065604.1 para-nitrobenzyl esterase [Pseudoxanthomonas broegbernensis]
MSSERPFLPPSPAPADGPADPHRRRLLQAAAALPGLALAGAAPPAFAAASPTVVARTRAGRVRGVRERGVHVFRGIRYGADTAPLRFQPPRAPSPWAGVAAALEPGASAPQRGEDGDEDCLFLNVWTPALRDGGRRPVLAYFHGGGYDTGAGSDPLYDGTRLCLRGDVVVVTVNHRLNAFGYLYLCQFGDARYAASGNAGQLDLVLALQWVRDNIAGFGGDAGNVTVFGQSGGGAKIATLMAMPAARGLFHRAWTMSGQQVTAAGPRAATQRARRFLAAAGIDPASADAIARLRALPRRTLVEATAVHDFSRVEDARLYFGPVMDGETLPRHPFWPDAPAQSAAIPMVVGNTRDETRAFLGNDPRNFALGWDDLAARLEKQQYVDIRADLVVAEYRRLYPHYTPSEVFFAATTAGRSWRGAVEELEARARQPGGAAPTWAYRLDWGSPLEGGRLRAFHTLDIPLVFDNVRQPGSRTGDGVQAQALADAMSGAVLAFARGGDPNHAGIPRWEPYSLPRRQTLLFDVPAVQADDPRGAERRFWQQAPFLQRGTS